EANIDAGGGYVRPAFVSLVHVHEGRDMEDLVDVRDEATCTGARREHIGVTLTPRRVGHVRDERDELHSVLVEAIVKADRIEAMAKRPDLGEEEDGSARIDVETTANEGASLRAERLRRIT